MKASQPVTSIDSGKSFISGLPFLIDDSDIVSESHLDEIMESIDTILGQVTNDLRYEAATDPAWSRHAEYLNVRFDNGKMVVSYDGPFEDEVRAIEYGTTDMPPSPLMRSAVADADSVSSRVNKEVKARTPLA